jgi:hypothetical protein
MTLRSAVILLMRPGAARPVQHQAAQSRTGLTLIDLLQPVLLTHAAVHVRVVPAPAPEPWKPNSVDCPAAILPL